MLDRDRLAKLLALTTSLNDNEALAAIRKANEIVEGAGLTWDQVLLPIADAVSPHVSVTINRFLHPEFYAAAEEWKIRQKR